LRAGSTLVSRKGEPIERILIRERLRKMV